jgi:hypothetical protein
MRFEIVLQLNTLRLRHVNLENTVLPPRTIPLKRSIRSTTVRILTHVIGNRQTHGYFEKVNA